MFNAYDVVVTSSQWIKLCAQTYCICRCTNICCLTDGDLPDLILMSSPVEHQQEAVTTRRHEGDDDEDGDLPDLILISSPVEHQQEAVTTRRHEGDDDEDGDLPGPTPTRTPVEYRWEAVTTRGHDDDDDESDDDEVLELKLVLRNCTERDPVLLRRELLSSGIVCSSQESTRKR
ncbi:uncharacterized protein AB9X84_025642 [Acanthopagrus schlegelii]